MTKMYGSNADLKLKPWGLGKRRLLQTDTGSVHNTKKWTPFAKGSTDGISDPVTFPFA